MRHPPISPVDGRSLARPLASFRDLDRTLARASQAAAAWRAVPVVERGVLLGRAVDALVARTDAIADEITIEMGRPRQASPGELRGLEDRARTMIALAESALAEVPASPRPGFARFIRREPLGAVWVLAAWNYPYLTATNAVFPALMAGNTVVLKHSEQTPSCPERFAAAFAEAGLPDGVFQWVSCSHDLTARAVADPRVDRVCFTGSVAGGRAVHAAAGGHLKDVALELGGCDPAWVRPDADLDATVAGLVDGAFFNSGQSCCGIERIYVHTQLYDAFVEAFAARVGALRLGDPRAPETTLGPVVRADAAARIRAITRAAVAQGARPLIDPADHPSDREGTPYLAPQVLIDVHHGMALMKEETFGPVVGIMRAADDDEAIAHMNDSRYGLTASVWTADLDAAMAIGERVQTGTWFMNRCDHLDPELAWVGVKDSGRGCSLSRLGYEQLTRPKSFHLRHA